MVLYQNYASPFPSRTARMTFDITFWVLAITYMIGNYFAQPNVMNVSRALTFIKPIPLLLIAWQLWPLKNVHSSVFKIFLGLALGAIGDVFMLINQTTQKKHVNKPSQLFIYASIAYWIGHCVYTLSFMESSKESSEKSRFQQIMRHRLVFVAIFTILVSFSIFILLDIVQKQSADRSLAESTKKFFSKQEDNFIKRTVLHKIQTKEKEAIQVIALIVSYSIGLLMMTMAAIMYFFISKSVDKVLEMAGFLAAFGACFFFFSCCMIAENNFTVKIDQKDKILSLFVLIFYYMGQFFIGKSAIKTAAFFQQRNEQPPV